MSGSIILLRALHAAEGADGIVEDVAKDCTSGASRVHHED